MHTLFVAIAISRVCMADFTFYNVNYNTSLTINWLCCLVRVESNILGITKIIEMHKKHFKGNNSKLLLYWHIKEHFSGKINIITKPYISAIRSIASSEHLMFDTSGIRYFKQFHRR